MNFKEIIFTIWLKLYTVSTIFIPKKFICDRITSDLSYKQFTDGFKTSTHFYGMAINYVGFIIISFMFPIVVQTGILIILLIIAIIDLLLCLICLNDSFKEN
jgi:hypothetical protein